MRIDGLQYCNFSEKIFRQMRIGEVDSVHVTICYHENFRETVANLEQWNRWFEQFPDLQVYTIARDGIAIATNPDIELPTLSVEQVRDIFAGEITNFSEVGGPDALITVVSREEGSGTRAAFEELGYTVEDDDFRVGHIFGVRMPKRLHLASVKGALEEERVSASLRGTALRISPHLYNDEEDMAALLRALRRAVGG